MPASKFTPHQEVWVLAPTPVAGVVLRLNCVRTRVRVEVPDVPGATRYYGPHEVFETREQAQEKYDAIINGTDLPPCF